ncbi:GerAB/ArcD/ProY family transporter [Virgibacillus sp. NKC19-16]|uniref:GerAB/ArcD/ProY family transporter n=1 Tax=Virgibacillus salidurans TaxID=2831673 RepID=UPI001F328003|nr:GerAB/ArcD/ProY family transporter [Virgibacillus sp. NKC19-16]UJL47529.1 GerAB/ArcD/ProY family transporter [Virgibacillus sp. NKC19-16]
MDLNVNVKPNLRIQAFYLFFIISFIQLGVGLMGTPRLVYLEAQQDAWISIIIALLFILLVIFSMFLILNQYDNADILGIQVDIFGKWLGKLLGTIYIIYFAVALVSVFIMYIEVVKIYIFPELSNLVLGLLLISLIIYSVLGGIRVIVGVSFIFFFLSIWVIFLLIDPALQADISHFRPMFQASFTELIHGAYATSYTFMGFEILFLIYPFIQNKEKAKKPVYMAIVWTAAIILIITVISIGFFSPEQMKTREWALLNLYKMQSLPFLERFDYIVVTTWMMVVLPNMLLLTWGMTYGLKRLYRIPQKITLYITAALLVISCFFLDNHFLIQEFTNRTSKAGFWLVYIYPLLLLPLVFAKKKWRRKKGGNRHVSP